LPGANLLPLPKLEIMIKIIVTGGTFDKEYDELNGRLFFKETHLPGLLELGRCQLEVEVLPMMLIDSLEMTKVDREKILSECSRCAQKQLVITHGTDTMELTARLLGEAGLDKTIILTGAMIPIKFGSSDGLFNLGSALAFAQTLPAGVYVAMNGRYFHWDHVRKNKRTGIFEEI